MATTSVSAEPGEHAALVALLRLQKGVADWARLAADVVSRGSARAVWDETRGKDQTLFETGADPLDQASADLEHWQAGGLWVVTILDPTYPAQLREVHEAPPLLFVRGNLLADDRGVSVVGSRSADARALSVARDIAVLLVGEGLSVLSGLARGVDTAAHRAALEHGGRTVAFLGTGITRCYPTENRHLQERIADEGLLVSQFWPDAPAQKWTFPMRNAVMSGYGRSTIVVAASETSGSRIQARVAVEHGRPVILMRRVVRETQWAGRLLGRPGVYVAETPDDVLRTVRDVARPLDDDHVEELLASH